MERFGCLLLILILTVSACATRTPQSLAAQEPYYVYVGQSKDFASYIECLFRKVDSFPTAMFTFSFEDATIPVQIRQFSDNAELYQEIAGQTIALIKLGKVSSSEIEAKLYTGNSLGNSKIRDNYPELIRSCFN